MRLPTIVMSEGRSVIDAIIITATAMAIPIANPLTNDKPIARRPSSAMITVEPAKSTARPDVSIASTTDSSMESPLWSPSRNRVTINKA